MKAIQRLVLAGCALGVWSCVSGGPKAPPVALESYFGALIDARCQFETRCGQFSDEAFCRAYLTKLLAQPTINSPALDVAAAQAGTSTYDPDAAGTCIHSIATAACQGREYYWSDYNGCPGVFTGMGVADDTCSDDAECESSSFVCAFDPSRTDYCSGFCDTIGSECDRSSQCGTGQVCDPDTQRCVDPTPPGALNQPCGSRLEPCEPGLFCKGLAAQLANGTPGTCVPLGQEGEACESGQFSCVSGLVCIPNDAGNGSSCVQPKGSMQPCQHTFECGGALSSLICDATHICVARPSTGACIKGVCDPLTAYCDLSQPDAPTCKPFKTAGANCADDHECDLALFCQPPAGASSPSSTSPGTCASIFGPVCMP